MKRGLNILCSCHYPHLEDDLFLHSFAGLAQGEFVQGNDLLMPMLLLQRKIMGHDKLYPFLCLVLCWGLIPTRSVFELPSDS